MNKTKAFRLINILISVLFCLATIGMIIYYAVAGDPNKRITISIGIAVMFLLPYLLELIFRFRFGNITVLIYTAFVIFSGFVGATLNVTYMFDWFNKVCHTIYGYLACFIGLFLLIKSKHYEKLSPLFIVIFCMLTSISTHALWEIWEFGCDNIIGTIAQGEKINGLAPYVTDTMTDIIVNLVGAIVFAIQYTIYHKCKTNFMLKAVINDMGYKKSEETGTHQDAEQVTANIDSQDVISEDKKAPAKKISNNKDSKKE